MTVRIGLLGSGFVNTLYLNGLQNAAGWEIPVVASPHLEHAQRFARRWGIPEGYSTSRQCVYCHPDVPTSIGI